MGLSDIDEDDPPVVAPPAKQQQGTAAALVGSPVPATPSPGSGVSTGPPAGRTVKKGFDLDDLFGDMNVAGDATGGTGSTRMGASAAPAAAPAPAPTRAPAPTNDVLDSLFAASPVSHSNPSPTKSGADPFGGDGKMTSANIIYVDDSFHSSPDDASNLFDTSKPVKKQTFSTAESLLEAFSNQGKKTGASRFTTKDSLNHLTKNKDDNKVRARLLAMMDYYDVLGVTSTASEEEIKRSYKKKALELHPDRVGRDQTPEEAELFKTITKAHEILTDAETRAEYDRQLRSGGPMGVPPAASGAGYQAGPGNAGMAANDWLYK